MGNSADAAFDVREQAGAPAVRFEDRAQEERRSRLAVRARDPGNLQLGRRVVEELDRRPGHRLPHAGNDDLRDVDREPAFDDQGRSASADRGGSVVVPVDASAGNAEEERAVGHGTRVVRELADLDGSAPNDLGRAERGDEPLQLHLASGV